MPVTMVHLGRSGPNFGLQPIHGPWTSGHFGKPDEETANNYILVIMINLKNL